MTIKFPRAFIFDWDNTLIDNWAAIRSAINETLTHFGRESWTPEQVKLRCNRAARESFPEWFGSDWKQAYEIFYRRFGEVHADELNPMTGAEDLLRWLHARQMPLFVVSNKRGDYLRQQVVALKWDSLFDAVIGSADTSRDKPARDPVDYALKQKNMKPDASVWFVGDTNIDMQCAINGNCTPVFMGDVAEAGRLGVNLVFSDCQALQSLLYNLAK